MSLQKFIDAQNRGPESGRGSTWNQAIHQLRRTGGKGSLHYAWYIFPQLAGVAQMVTGHAPTAISRYYAINNLEQAVAYLENAELRNHLMIFATEMTHIAPHRSIGAILGIGDASKFKSSMTLFLIAALIRRDDNAVTTFRNALLRFGAARLYDNLDPVTLIILRNQHSPLLANVPRGVFTLIQNDEGGSANASAQDNSSDTNYTEPWLSPSDPRRNVPPAPAAAQEEHVEPISLLDQIVAMGFPAGNAASALARADPPGNVAAAIQLLLDEQREIPADPPAAAPARQPRRKIGRLPSGVQGSSRRPRIARSKTRAKKWPKVQTGRGRRTRRRRTRRRRRRYSRKKRQRRYRKKKTRKNK